MYANGRFASSRKFATRLKVLQKTSPTEVQSICLQGCQPVRQQACESFSLQVSLLNERFLLKSFRSNKIPQSKPLPELRNYSIKSVFLLKFYLD